MWLIKFLFWCSAAPYKDIIRCPKSEQQKYIKLGLIVLIPALFAFLSASYAFSTIVNKDDHWLLSEILTVLGLSTVWTFSIFAIDIYIIATFKKLKRSFFNVIPRLVFSIILGLVISHPIVLKVLEDPINLKIIDIQNEAVDSLEIKRHKELDLRVNKEINEFNTEKERLDSLKSTFAVMHAKELQGEGSKTNLGKKNPGDGDIAKGIDKKFNNYNTESEELDDKFEKRKLYLLDTLQLQINEKWDSLISSYRSKPNMDILAKSIALSRMFEDEQKKNRHTALIIYAFILLTCVLLDSMAFLLKLLTPLGPLDYYLEEQDIKYQVDFEAYKDTYLNEYKKRYDSYLTQKIALEIQIMSIKEILQKTEEFTGYIINERKEFYESLKELIAERQKVTDKKKLEDLDRVISGVTETFLNSIDQSNQKFKESIRDT